MILFILFLFFALIGMILLIVLKVPNKDVNLIDKTQIQNQENQTLLESNKKKAESIGIVQVYIIRKQLMR